MDDNQPGQFFRLKLCFNDNIRVVRISKHDNLQSLKAGVKSTYRELQNVEVVVKYEDVEGDTITIVSDDALALAFEDCLGGPTVPKFLIQAVPGPIDKSKNTCKYFQRGNCRNGKTCKDLHSGEENEKASLITSKQMERWLERQWQESAADNVEQLSSPQGLQKLHKIADSGRLPYRAALMLVKLLTKEEIRTSMLKENTNKIYGMLMGTRFITEMQMHINSRYPTVSAIEPFLLLVEELQLRTNIGWKCLPLDSLSAAVAQLPEGGVKGELAGKVAALLEQRRRLQLLAAISDPDTSLKGAAFRNVQIIPSKEELLMTENVLAPVNKVDLRYGSMIEYLETHFRLLREDFIEPLRSGVKEYQRLVKQSAEVQVYTNVQLQAIKFSVNGIESRITFACGNRVLDQRLMFGSLLCISRDNFNTIIWATVSGRKNVASGKVEIQLLEGNELEAKEIYVMVESTAAYFEAYSHVLKSLQREDMEKLPFIEHLISLVREVKEPEYLKQRKAGDLYDFKSAFPELEKEIGQSAFHIMQKWPKWSSTLDSSQLMALKHGLTKRLAIIQGPPGTGKTFIGLLLVKVLLQNLKQSSADIPDDVKGPILIVCYTNHALDQFLEGIYKTETSIIRIGGRCKSEVLDECNLQKLIQKKRESRSLAGAHARASGQSRAQRQELEKQIERCLKVLEREYVTLEMLHGVATEEQIANLGQRGSKSANVAKTWLETETKVRRNTRAARAEQEEANMFAILDSDDEEAAAYVRTTTENSFEPERGDAEEGWVQVNRQRNVAQQLRNNPEEFVLPLHVYIDEPDVWSLPNGARRALHQYWMEEIHANAQREYTRLTQEYLIACKQCKEADSEIQLSLLRGAKIIGMTTTAAARLHDMLVSLKPEIVIVEEAAEVLEAHILASISPHTKHLILIGDHLQLRPSVATYKLAVKHRLDVSLFERMVSNGVEHVMLQVQRRMKPSISKLISSIYPSLKDHESVASYEDIKGMKSSVFFFDHRAPEKNGHEAGSKVNVTEAELIVELCNYLLNQSCYKPSDITILAMYTGQVQEINRRLKERLRYHSLALQRLGSETVPEISERIVPRVSSVDDFQGEENEIILLSLVRSNSIVVKDGVGKIGFLNIPNRVCVALSRARKGLYIFGNAKLLSEKNQLWNDITEKLKEDGFIGSRLVLRCQNHPKIETSIQHAHDFKQAEDGGCSLPCEYQLQCGHVCPRRCHPGTHNAILCPKRCLKPFSECSHRCRELCHACSAEDCPPCKEQVLKNISRCGHNQIMNCSENESRVTCLNPCKKLLPCGHKCPVPCGRPCATSCDKKTVKVLPCGHSATMPCYLDASTFLCTEPCREILPDCKHECAGTCGKCKQKTEHIPCQRKCGRDLPCGHQCKDSCIVACPPCSEPCKKRCLHSICSKICGKPCKSCQEPCSWRCPHFRCDLLCFEVCKRPRCDQPCILKNKCGHPCIGLCGEPCPNKCRICDPETLDVISQITLGESEPEDLFIELLDCKHIFEVSNLDRWMDMKDDCMENGNEAIKLKACPECRVPIRRTYRYANVVKRKLQQIEEVKKKVYGYERMNLGFELLKNKENDAARKNFLEAIKIQAGLYEAHFGLGVVFCHEKEFSRAISHLRLIVERSTFAAQVGNIQEVPSIPAYCPLPKGVRLSSLTAKPSEELATKSLIQWASALSCIKMFTEAVQLCEIVLKNHKDDKIAASIREQAQRGVTHQVVQAISRDFGSAGHWFQCRNGHIYAIGECGGAMETSKCPDCNEVIGGAAHTLASGNTHSTVDGSSRALYNDATGLGNINIADLQL